MSGALEIRGRLQATAAALLERDLIPDRVRDALAEASMSSDVLEVMQTMAVALVEAKDAEDAAVNAAEQIRSILLVALEETGCPSLRLPNHTVSMVSGRTGFTVTDPAALPPELLKPPQPAADRAAIQKLLDAGRAVPGVASTNGAPHLAIRSTRK